jgi:hydroxyacylglutathione hydrolase
MEVHAVVDEGLGNTAWVVELGDGAALVVDPERDPSAYLRLAERLGSTVVFSADTHLHADFVTGSRELAARSATVFAPAAAGITWPHQGLGPGDEVDLGRLRLRAVATPGHTPEHLAYLLVDTDVPLALFSGGSLLVGAVARTDLVEPDRTEDLARQLWRSLHDHVLGLPDDLPVYPTHGAGSFCSAPAGTERQTTIGQERAKNPLLACEDEDTFVARLLSGLGTYPPYFLELREVNRRGPAVYGSFPGLAALGPQDVQRLLHAGAAVVDVRPVAEFGAGHLPGSLSIALRPQFASWLGWLTDRRQPLVFVLGAGQDGAEVVRQCLTIGYENLAGELAGGIEAWKAAGLPIARVPLASAPEVPTGGLLDVRQQNEYEAGHLPDAVHIELGALVSRMSEVPAGPLTVHCAHGERAMTAASLLAAAGRHGVTVLRGGPEELAASTGERLVS